MVAVLTMEVVALVGTVVVTVRKNQKTIIQTDIQTGLFKTTHIGEALGLTVTQRAEHEFHECTTLI